MEIAGITLTINKHTGRYGVSDLTKEQQAAIYADLNQRMAEVEANDLLIELFEYCEKFKDFTADYNGNEMHYQWMDQMRGQRPAKF